jgi:hypothetical protein
MATGGVHGRGGRISLRDAVSGIPAEVSRERRPVAGSYTECSDDDYQLDQVQEPRINNPCQLDR